MRLAAHTVPGRNLIPCASACRCWQAPQRGMTSGVRHSVRTPIIHWLEAGGGRPSWEAVAPESPATKCLVDQWETLRVDERGVLVKRWVALSGVGSDAWVVLVPRALRAGVNQVLPVVTWARKRPCAVSVSASTGWGWEVT